MRTTAMEVGLAKGMRSRWLTLAVTLAFTGSMVLPVLASQTIDYTDEPAYQEGYEQGQAYRDSYQQPIEEQAKEDEKDAVNALLVAGGVALVVGLVYYFCIRDRGQAQTPADNKGSIIAGRTWDVTISSVCLPEVEAGQESASLAIEPSLNVCWRF